MDTTIEKRRAFAGLGFENAEAEKIVEKLNLVLANYHLHYQKLRNFHWNIEGRDFFELHEKFEEEYNGVQLKIDEVAERIRVFGKKPISNFSDYLGIAKIKEVKGPIQTEEMVKEILNDFEILLSFLSDTIETASEVGDSATEDMMTEFIRAMEKTHWMFSAWLKRA